MKNNLIDISFDFRTDSRGLDPDKYSPTLRKYHTLLWTKPLPNGKILTLDKNLSHKSELGRFFFASDNIIHSFALWERYRHIISQVPKTEIDQFSYLGYTIGGMIIFPKNQINRKLTINQARGWNRKIGDRFDLTLECIRRYYKNEDNPLNEVLSRYKFFFELFGSYKNYINFFLLQDLVGMDYSEIKFFTKFDNFQSNPLPNSLDEYVKYKKNSIYFINKRNLRILKWSEKNL